MTKYWWLLLGLLALGGCPKRTETPPDYGSVRQNSEKAHQSLDQQKGEPGQ